MATSDANDTSIDPQLDSQFSHLTMTPSQGDPNVDHSPFWPAHAATFSSGTGLQTVEPQYHLHDNTLAPQMNAQQSSTESYQYLDNIPYQAYPPPGDSSAQAGPSSANHATADYPFVCDYDGCNKGFNRQCDLDKHQNNHTKRRKCEYCDAGGAETKDLNRHMWTHHPDLARQLGVPREWDRCSKCGYAARKDNVKRHKDRKGHW
ncbi:hypothetical protein C8A03DRAFT_19887 [Achaetomium macrosporum]|uniref:C2H2-type domain-containing protein n=1 Tax=Achaetomium macrosporum TaxID=79813 RepID=A0AAN7C088_9PEZI|nr:hypothetical protein C8A03DRAFT_19887 [Achaetomium macrosporum]